MTSPDDKIPVSIDSTLHPAPGTLNLSLCMIVRDEEENLPPCIAAIESVVDEIVVVDTGSRDGTVAVAESLGARVFEFEWIDDFSAARNESIRHARGQYILWLDADDRIPPESRDALRGLRRELSPRKDAAYALLVECRTASGESVNYYQVRIFPNLPGAAFEGRAHEEIVPSLKTLGISLMRKEIRIIHTGYEDLGAATAKARRNLQILSASRAKDGISAKETCDIGQCYFGLREYEKCALYLEEARRAGPASTFYKKTYPMLADCYLQTGRGDKALRLLRLALEQYPESGYIHFLTGGALTLLGRHVEAVPYLEKAIHLGEKVEDFPIPSNLRSRVLLFIGRCFEGIGHFEEAVNAYENALRSTPADTDALKSLGFLMCRLGRFEKALETLTRAKESIPHPDKQIHLALAAILLSFQDYQEARGIYRELLENDPTDADAKTGMARVCSVMEDEEHRKDLPLILWEGTFFVHHSLALVNRELSLALIRSGRCRMTLLPYEKHEFGAEEDPDRFPLIQDYLHRSWEQRVDFHVRHQWPPCFSPPPSGHWIIMPPWEFGSLPSSWLPHFQQEIDDIWVYSNFLRECYVHDGVDPERIAVIPLAVDRHRFHPGVPPLPRVSEWTTKGFKFLFVGGTLWRKGADTLLDAYCRAFTRCDDVSLLIKDMGKDSFYRGQDMGERIRKLKEDPDSPEIVYFTDTLSEKEISSLYRACDCLAHPYRGEGFGLPIAEAMASGLPVLIPRGGAADDFTSDQTVYYVPAEWMRVKLDEETVKDPFVLHIDPDALAEGMRYVFSERDEARSKGRCASEYILSHLSWERSTQAILQRLEVLKKRPIRRFALRGGVERRLPPRANEENREKARNYNSEGLKHYEAGRIERAELQFVRAIQTDGDFVEPRNNLAVLYWKKGRTGEALAQMAEALKIDPHDLDVMANIELMAMENSSLRKAPNGRAFQTDSAIS